MVRPAFVPPMLAKLVGRHRLRRPTLADLHRRLVARERPTSPFVDKVRERAAPWAEPDLVANFAFTEWTTDNKLRHPRYEGLRPDKDPRAVTRERS
jgi:bifunctional non-homologous end joining protein LigD